MCVLYLAKAVITNYKVSFYKLSPNHECVYKLLLVFSYRFLTYHCLLYNETSWCQPGGQFPLKQTTNIQTQVQSLTHKTDSTATADGIHSQSLTKAITQQSKAEATSGKKDKSNGIPKSHSSTTINHQVNSKIPNDTVHPQRSNQDYLQRLTVTASDQGHSNNT